MQGQEGQIHFQSNGNQKISGHGGRGLRGREGHVPWCTWQCTRQWGLMGWPRNSPQEAKVQTLKNQMQQPPRMRGGIVGKGGQPPDFFLAREDQNKGALRGSPTVCHLTTSMTACERVSKSMHVRGGGAAALPGHYDSRKDTTFLPKRLAYKKDFDLFLSGVVSRHGPVCLPVESVCRACTPPPK